MSGRARSSESAAQSARAPTLWRKSTASWRRWQPSRRSDVHAGGERVVLDEDTPRLDLVAHQLGENVARLVDLLDVDLQERARVGVEGGLPQLVRVHLAQ